jgi:hypothetical protein
MIRELKNENDIAGLYDDHVVANWTGVSCRLGENIRSQ